MRVFIVLADQSETTVEAVCLLKVTAERLCARLNAEAQKKRLELAAVEAERVLRVTGRPHPMSLKAIAAAHFSHAVPQYRVEEHVTQVDVTALVS